MEAKRRKISRSFAALVALAALFMGAATASAWWNGDWEYRRKIAVDSSPQGADIAETLADFPILVRLHSGNFDFQQARSDGTDLRFVAGDDQTPLSYHIERYDSVEGMALVWVKVPSVAGYSAANHLWMYYGNPDAPNAENPGATYDPATQAVFHFSESDGTPRDSTANANNASEFIGALGVPGAIGTAGGFNGAGDRMVIPAKPSLAFKDGLTFSAWVRITTPQSGAYLMCREEGAEAILAGISGQRVFVRVVAQDGTAAFLDNGPEIPLDSWHHVAVVLQPKARIIVYLDGVEAASAPLATGSPELAREIVLGASHLSDGHFLFGDLDEVGIATVPRSASWIRALALNQGPEGFLAAPGEEEKGKTSWLPTFYIGTIVRNISIDGWLIIGTLAVISLVSWCVFITKTFSLKGIQAGNGAFAEAFESADDPLSIGDAPEFAGSSLAVVYGAGREAVRRRLGNPKQVIPARSLGAVRTSLERAMTGEVQRLNAWMGFMTLAISGGPFLGLLGTVWGVMNTFAAMAEAGEANLAAIAPGMASALATTVAGLLVAIPALFSYNSLVLRVKALTADLYNFVDEFSARVEERYGGDA